MLIVDSQIHLWENARMSPHHRQIPTYNVDDALEEMAEVELIARARRRQDPVAQRDDHLRRALAKEHWALRRHMHRR